MRTGICLKAVTKKSRKWNYKLKTQSAKKCAPWCSVVIAKQLQKKASIAAFEKGREQNKMSKPTLKTR